MASSKELGDYNQTETPELIGTTPEAAAPSMVEMMLSETHPNVSLEPVSDDQQDLMSVEEQIKIASEESRKLEEKIQELQIQIPMEDKIKHPNVSPEPVSDGEEDLLSDEEKIKIALEESRKLEEKIQELLTQIPMQDKEIMELELHRAQQVRERDDMICKAQSLNVQKDELQKKLDAVTKENVKLKKIRKKLQRGK